MESSQASGCVLAQDDVVAKAPQLLSSFATVLPKMPKPMMPTVHLSYAMSKSDVRMPAPFIIHRGQTERQNEVGRLACAMSCNVNLFRLWGKRSDNVTVGNLTILADEYGVDQCGR
jgi:hypothetical protein